jgi:Spy/CpxP family protein refolding chaperone
MKKSVLIVGVIAAVLGVTAWSYAHMSGSGYGYGRGFYRMGPGMHGPRHMAGDWGPGHGPCWQATELTQEQQEQVEEQAEERAKAAAEQYIKRFLPDYKLEKKTTE